MLENYFIRCKAANLLHLVGMMIMNKSILEPYVLVSGQLRHLVVSLACACPIFEQLVCLASPIIVKAFLDARFLQF